MELALHHPVDVGTHIEKEIDLYLQKLQQFGRSLFLFVDARVWDLQKEWLRPILELIPTSRIQIVEDPEKNKTIQSVEKWSAWALEQGASRSSVFVACGGGALLDSVGFLASVFKRGVSTLYLPSTLLAMVDAAIGGKTAVNIDGSKNVIGTFKAPLSVFCDTTLLATLPPKEMASGWGEIVKYGLLQGEEYINEIFRYSMFEVPSKVYPTIILNSIEYKQQVVQEDPYEQGIRKYLNLGHTVGHALESWAFQFMPFPLSHGEAVAAGLIVDLYLSVRQSQLDPSFLRRFVSYYKENFSKIPFSCSHYPFLLKKMRGDKKNEDPEKMLFIILPSIGTPQTRLCSASEITEALDFYQEMY